MQLSTKSLYQLFASLTLSIMYFTQPANSASDNISTAIAFQQFDNDRMNTEAEYRMKSIVDDSKNFKICNFEITSFYIGKTQAYSERLASRSADSVARRLIRMGVKEINIFTKSHGYVGLNEKNNTFALIKSECTNEVSDTTDMSDDFLLPNPIKPSINKVIALSQSQ